MMSDTARLEEGIRRAAQAGDAAAVRALGTELRRVQASAPPTPVPDGDWRELNRRLSAAESRPVGPGMGEMVDNYLAQSGASAFASSPGARSAIAAQMQAPPTRDEAESRRRMAAREEGLMYGSARGDYDFETFTRSMANMGGLGLPSLLEAATSGFGSGVSFPEAHEFIKAADEGRVSESPFAGGAGMAAGILGQAAALPRFIPSLAQVPQTIGQAARIGAGVGGGTAAIDAAVNSRFDPMITGQSAFFGTLLGAGAGAAVQAAAPLVASAGRAVGDRVRFVTRSPRENAAVHVSRSFENIPRTQIDDVLAHPDAVLLDAGETAARDTFRGATNLSTRAHEQGSRFLRDRAGREAATLSDDVTRAMGGTQSVAQSQDAIRRAAQQQTSELYRRAFSEAPDVWDDALARFVQSNIGRDLVPDAMERVNAEYARRALQGEPVIPPPMPFVVDDLGNVSLRPDSRVGLEFWDAMSKELNDRVTSALSRNERTRSVALGEISRALKARLDTASPTYGLARGAAAEAFGAQDAVEAGALAVRDMARDGRDVQQLIAGLSPEDRLRAAQGAGSDLVRQIGASERAVREGGTRSIVNNVFTPERQRRIAMLAPSEQASEDLLGALRMWGRFADSRAALGNSNTARQVATQAAIAGAPIVGSAAINQGMPDPQAIALGLALAGGNAARVARGQAISDDIVRYYLSRGPVPTPAPIISPIPQGAQDAIRRSLLLGTGITAGQTVAP